MSITGGILTALLTPYDAKGNIHGKELEKLIRFNLEMGADGFYVSGSTGEAFLLSIEERKELLDIAAAAAGGKCTLVAQVGCIATRQTVELAACAEKAGYDAVSSVAPFYYKFTLDEVKDHYRQLASAVKLPVIIYNIPALSGVALGIEDLCELLDDVRFAGIKHTSSDFYQLERIKNRFPGKVVFGGYDEMFLAALAMGADGGIGSTYNFMADKFVAIRAAVSRGELDQARQLQGIVNRIISILIKVGVLAGEKQIVQNLGFNFNPPRAPFRPLSDEGCALIRGLMPLITGNQP